MLRVIRVSRLLMGAIVLLVGLAETTAFAKNISKGWTDRSLPSSRGAAESSLGRVEPTSESPSVGTRKTDERAIESDGESIADSSSPSLPARPSLQGLPECTFFLVRHGQSKPNMAGKIVSGMEDGADPANGLTEEGLQEARQAGEDLKEIMLETGCSPANTMVVTSPFSRAKETAEAIQDCLDCELREERDLRERWFGNFEGRNDTASYQKVWALDGLSARHSEFGVESATDVAQRAAAVVQRIRKEVSIRQRFYTGDEGQPFPPGPSAVILVSHGDALQLLQCFLAGRPLEQHRSLPHLENCGIRVLRPPPVEGRSNSEERHTEGERRTDGSDTSGGEKEGVVDSLQEAFRMTGARVLRPTGQGEGKDDSGVDRDRPSE